jgi:hypothetical protein
MTSNCDFVVLGLSIVLTIVTNKGQIVNSHTEDGWHPLAVLAFSRLMLSCRVAVMP